jgi:hypothetical protein
LPKLLISATFRVGNGWIPAIHQSMGKLKGRAEKPLFRLTRAIRRAGRGSRRSAGGYPLPKRSCPHEQYILCGVINDPGMMGQ